MNKEETKLSLSVLEELYELGWPNMQSPIYSENSSTLFPTKNNHRPSYIKIDAPGEYDIGKKYYGTNNPDTIVRDGSLFLELTFVGYSSIDKFAIFEVGNRSFRAIVQKIPPINYIDDYSVTIANIFNGKNAGIVDITVFNGRLIPISYDNIISLPSLVLAMEDHI